MKNKNKVKPLKLNILVFEIFENGKKVKEVKGYAALDRYLYKRDSQLKAQGYKVTEESTGGYAIYTNYKTQQCVFMAHRLWEGLHDCDGNRIYNGDYLEDKLGITVGIEGNWDWAKGKQDGTFRYWRTEGVGYREHRVDVMPQIENLDFIKEDGIRVKKNCFEFFG